MDVPGAVEEALDGEAVAAQVPLGGDDQLFVTPTRTLVYRGEGLLSDESVAEYDHAAEHVVVSEGRRKATIELTSSLDETQQLTVPADRLDDALLPVLAGVLHTNNVIADGESVQHAYRFSELSLVITSEQLIKHIGEAVWDTDFEAYQYDEITGIDTEEGDVSTQLVIEVDGRPERIKTPKVKAREVQQHLEEAIRAYHDIAETADLNVALSPTTAEDPSGADATEDTTMAFEDGIDPLGTTDGDDLDEIADTASATTKSEPTQEATLTDAGFEPAENNAPAVHEELTALRTAIEEQNELLVKQQETINQLIEELRRGR